MRKKDLGSNKTSRAKPASKGKKNRSEVTKKGTGKRPGIKGHDKDAAGAVKNTRIFNEVDSIEREDRVEGKNSVFEAIRSGRPLNKLFVEKDSQDVLVLRIIAMAREKDIPIQYLERNKLDSISQQELTRVLSWSWRPRNMLVEDILGTAEGKEKSHLYCS